jgi:hypothetical protein
VASVKQSECSAVNGHSDDFAHAECAACALMKKFNLAIGYTHHEMVFLKPASAIRGE